MRQDANANHSHLDLLYGITVGLVRKGRVYPPMCKSEGVLWQGTMTHIAIPFEAKTPPTLSTYTYSPSKKFFIV